MNNEVKALTSNARTLQMKSNEIKWNEINDSYCESN